MKKGWRSLILALATFGFAFPNAAQAQSFVRMTSPEVTQNESAGPITIGITLPTGRTRSFTIAWQFDPATSPQSDMTVTSGTINVTAGATIANIATTLVDDADASGPRRHTVSISTTDPGFPVAPDAAQTILRVNDNDLPNFPGLASDGIVGSITPRPGGGFLATGIFTNIMGSQFPGFVALRPNGRPDLSVAPIQYNFNAPPGAALEMPDGKFLIAGRFATINGLPRPHLARLNADGTVDQSFALSAPFISPPTGMILASDGSILVAANNGATQDNADRGAIVRVLADGTVDPNFATTVLANDEYGLFALPDGKFLVYGNARATATPWIRTEPIPPPLREGLIRVNLDGSIDLSFQADYTIEGFPRVPASQFAKAINRYPDGRLLVGGILNSIRGESVPGLVRLSSEGEIDMPFLANVRAAMASVGSSAAQRVAMSANGAIALAHQLPVGSRLVFLNPDGTLAGSAQISRGFIGSIAALEGERFLFSFSNLVPQRLAIYTAAGRLEPEPIAALAPISHDGAQFTLKIHSLVTGQLNLRHTGNFENWTSMAVEVVAGEQTIPLPSASPHTFFQVANPAN